jgi:hypothetical protein
MTRVTNIVALLALATLTLGCERDNEPKGAGDKGIVADAGKYILAQEPPQAKDVKHVRKEAKNGDDVVIVGRIGGSAKPWVEGRAVFWIVDRSFRPCNERPGDNCETPWDYCCDDPEELRKGIATVKVVDEQSQTVGVDARQLLGLKELQTVVVHGRAERDEQGNLTILASGVFRKAD